MKYVLSLTIPNEKLKLGISEIIREIEGLSLECKIVCRGINYDTGEIRALVELYNLDKDALLKELIKKGYKECKFI